MRTNLVLLSLCLLSLVACNQFNVTQDGKAAAGQEPIVCKSPVSKLLNKSLTFERSKLPLNFYVPSLKLKDRDVSYVDFSHSVGLTVDMLNSSSAIKGIKLPINFNVTGLKTENKDISDIDFSQTRGLTVAMLNSAQNMINIKLPVGFNVSGLVMNGRALYGIDFSQTVGFSVNHFQDSRDIGKLVLPAGFDFTGFDGTRTNLVDMDLSGTTNFDVGMLNKLVDITDLKLPAMSLTGFNTSTKDLVRVDLSLTSDFDQSMLDSAHSVLKPKLPAGSTLTHTWAFYSIDYTGVTVAYDGVSVFTMADLFVNSSNVPNISYPNAMLADIDFSATTELIGSDLSAMSALTGMHLNNIWLTNVKLPTGLDFSGVTLGTSITDIDLSQTTNLTIAALPTQFVNNRFPASFDMSAVDFTASTTDGTDFSNTTGFDPSKLNDSDSYDGIVLPSGADVSSLDLDSRNISGIDFSTSTGFSADIINDADYAAELKLPASVDVREIQSSYKFMSHDFSLISDVCVLN